LIGEKSGLVLENSLGLIIVFYLFVIIYFYYLKMWEGLTGSGFHYFLIIYSDFYLFGGIWGRWDF